MLPIGAAAGDGGIEAVAGRTYPLHRETFSETDALTTGGYSTLDPLPKLSYNLPSFGITLQLSKFVDYTLQCIKLPNLPAPGEQVAMETGPVTAVADSTTCFQGISCI